MLIYFIGMPASGKSTFGNLVAHKLGYNFLDLDHLIEQRNTTVIPKIFEEKGEVFFREEEKHALQTTFNLEKTIVATGGGTPCFFDNLSQMKKNGIVCFLNVEIEVLAQRTFKAQQKQQDNRPLFKEASSFENLLEMITKKWQDRKKYYQQAHFEIRNNDVESFIEKLAHFER
ncbi:shikimate kinase [Bernardetia sp.]|uniref:shikimate kinase n=1 Tax=Bernardetia sp. TaxID=1937974 RepID=UPI0025C151B8|nr:shikimate kinase [Bernardetia sp.]